MGRLLGGGTGFSSVLARVDGEAQGARGRMYCQSLPMTELLIILVVGLLLIAGATLIGPRLGIASPLVLVAIGVAASFLPVFASVHIEPELIIAGILPPLLYSAAVSMPSM